jgi:hypothetical protein
MYNHGRPRRRRTESTAETDIHIRQDVPVSSTKNLHGQQITQTALLLNTGMKELDKNNNGEKLQDSCCKHTS